MFRILTALAIKFRNHRILRKLHASRHVGLNVGYQVLDEQRTPIRLTIPNGRCAEHIGILGKTGTGKSSLLRFLLKQDIMAGRGFACFDLHPA